MDFTLRCNSLKCRSQLADEAVVTTCSHIFCLPCSEHHGLLAPASDRRVCPACHTILINHDDAASTNLNPPEDYKTSVLSGLSPTTIMECAGRGLAFWAYQSTQEIIYQEFLARSLTDKCQWLNGDMERIVHEANSEIDSLSQKLSQMEVEHEKMKADKANLAAALREKARKHQQTHELYERLRRKEMAAATQSAAFDTADDVLQYGHNRPHDSHLDLESAVPYNNHGRAGSDGSGGPGGASRPPARGTPAVRGPSLHTRGECLFTPNQQRTSLGGPGLSNIPVPGSMRRDPAFVQPSRSTQTVRRSSGNFPSHSAGKLGGTSGLSAGMRTGRTHGNYSR